MPLASASLTMACTISACASRFAHACPQPRAQPRMASGLGSWRHGILGGTARVASYASREACFCGAAPRAQECQARTRPGRALNARGGGGRGYHTPSACSLSVRRETRGEARAGAGGGRAVGWKVEGGRWKGKGRLSACRGLGRDCLEVHADPGHAHAPDLELRTVVLAHLSKPRHPALELIRVGLPTPIPRVFYKACKYECSAYGQSSSLARHA